MSDTILLAVARHRRPAAAQRFLRAAETALTVASKPLMHTLEADGDRRAGLVNRLYERRERLMGVDPARQHPGQHLRLGAGDQRRRRPGRRGREWSTPPR